MSQMRSDSGQPSKRGTVLVFINYKFPDEKYDLTKGNDIDEITRLFKPLGYDVRSFTNFKSKKILGKVGLYARKKKSESLVCFLSSHGDTTSLMGADGRDVRIEQIFEAADSDELDGKPKTFFIDACRSRRGEKVTESHLPDLPRNCYFVGFSCLASKPSFTGKQSCGAYFEALISVFKESFKLPPIDKENGIRRNIDYLVQKAHHQVEKQNGQMPEMRSTMAGEYFLQGDGCI